MNQRHLVRGLGLALLLALALAGLAPAQAQVTHTTTRTSIPIESFFPGGLYHDFTGCFGEDILFSGGAVDAVIQTTTDTTGVRHYHYHDNVRQGVTGIGLTTGATYRFTGAPADANFDVFGPPPDEFVLTNHFTIIGVGQAANAVVHVNTHIQINANGDVTSSVNIFSIECH